MQGALLSLASLTSIANPVLMTTLFAATSNPSAGIYLPGSPYLLAGIFYLIGWIVMTAWQRRHREVAPLPAS